jgi:hypothetical protein
MANEVCGGSVAAFGGSIWTLLNPFNERHLKIAVTKCVPITAASLEAAIPEQNQASVPTGDERHKPPAGHRVMKRAVLGGGTMNTAW